ncbi:MAG TPA: AbrB/MazE/SpoVT family DNA-binding domain-containing protein [Vicinamibacterales bacterium]|nr:AbrB/MazE/SpoVT family DNA-binding domain-containing protein [Vicinamibacterales bacterium]
MALARSRITAQGQVSVPAEVRRRLGAAPGATLEWHDADGEIVVRRSGRFRSEDIHKALFAEKPKRRTLPELKDGLRRAVRAKHARR